MFLLQLILPFALYSALVIFLMTRILKHFMKVSGKPEKTKVSSIVLVTYAFGIFIISFLGPQIGTIIVLIITSIIVKESTKLKLSNGILPAALIAASSCGAYYVFVTALELMLEGVDFK